MLYRTSGSVLSLALLVLSSGGCDGALDGQGRVLEGEPAPSALLHGVVRDQWGQPLAGAHIELLNRAANTVTSGQEGEFALRVPLDQAAYRIRASLSGFVSSFARYDGGATQPEPLAIELIEAGATGTFQTDAEATVEITHAGATIRLPADGLAYQDDGTRVTGEVAYQITYLPPSRLLGAEESGIVMAVDVELRAGGEPVNLAPGYTAEIELVTNYAGAGPHAALTGYFFDPSTFMWVPEGRWPTRSSEGRTIWSAEVRHFSSHGAGPYTLVCHVPPGDPASAHTISVTEYAVDAHLAHGDSMDACPGAGPADPDGGADDDCECVILHHEADGGGGPIVAGQDLSEAYAVHGIHIVATDNSDLATPPIAFDTANPTGADFDLGSPNEAYAGPGIGTGGASNDHALGHVLIVAEDDVDLDADDLVDDPDDQSGFLYFTFDSPSCVHTVELLDIDEEAWMWLYDITDTQIGSRIDIPDLDENSYQLVDVNTCGVSSMTVQVRGSGGALADIGLCLGGDDGVCADAGDPCAEGSGAVGPDTDGDGVIDECDICDGGDDADDLDGDGVPDECDSCRCDEAVIASALAITAATTSPFPSGTYAGGYWQVFPAGSEDFLATFDNGYVPADQEVNPDWLGDVTISFSMAPDDTNTDSDARQSVGNRVTEYHDYDPYTYDNRSGRVFNIYGRGSFIFQGSNGDADHHWEVTYDFSSLALGYLPAGTILGFSDIDGSTHNESVLLTATLVSAGSDPWLAYDDDAPNPDPGHGTATYDAGENSYLFDGPDSSNDHIAYVTTEDVTQIAVSITQGTFATQLSLKIAAPVLCVDDDADGLENTCDICPGGDDNSGDPDGDGVPADCDICALGDDNVDTDSDGVPDACEPPCTGTRELCDGLDNDCNGQVDEGNDLCGLGAICVGGECINT